MHTLTPVIVETVLFIVKPFIQLLKTFLAENTTFTSRVYQRADYVWRTDEVNYVLIYD